MGLSLIISKDRSQPPRTQSKVNRRETWASRVNSEQWVREYANISSNEANVSFQITGGKEHWLSS